MQCMAKVINMTIRTTFPMIYSWKNNEKRKLLYGKKCRIISRLKKNSIVVEFEDGSRECVSAYSLRKP